MPYVVRWLFLGSGGRFDGYDITGKVVDIGMITSVESTLFDEMM